MEIPRRTGRFSTQRQRRVNDPPTETDYALSSDDVCSPHSHLNMRTLRPFVGLSIDRTMAGFLSHWLHVRIGLGSKLEKNSFLNSSFTDSRAPPELLR
jgi:hypothetical protein